MRILKSQMRNSFNFLTGINAIVRCLCAFRVGFFFTKINTTGKFTENDKVNSFNIFCFSGENDVKQDMY